MAESPTHRYVREFATALTAEFPHALTSVDWHTTDAHPTTPTTSYTITATTNPDLSDTEHTGLTTALEHFAHQHGFHVTTPTPGTQPPTYEFYLSPTLSQPTPIE